MGDSERPEPGFQRALIDAVRPVTPALPGPTRRAASSAALQQDGVVHLAQRASGLCGGMTETRFVTTTELYPDGPSASPALCNEAQVAAVRAAIDYLLKGSLTSAGVSTAAS